LLGFIPNWRFKTKGILISPAGVRSVWLCNDLENFQKRLKALDYS